MQRLLLFSFYILFGISVYSQGKIDGFYKKQGELDFVLGSGAQLEDKYFAGTQKIGLTRSIINVNAFLAAGITDRLNLNASLPYIIINDEQNFQDLNLQLKYHLFQYQFNNRPMTLQGGVSSGYAIPSTQYQTEGLNAIGQQAKVIDLRAYLHLSIKNAYFITLQGAKNTKSNPSPNAVNAALKFGHYSAKSYWDLWYDFQQSDGGLDYRGTPSPSTFKELGVDFHKVGGTYYKPLSNKVGVFGSLAYVLKGRNVGQGIGINLGLVLKGHYLKKIVN